jgi:hypothetical protein
MGLRFSFPIELRIDLTSLPQGWKEEVVSFLLEQSITYEGETTKGPLKDSLMESPLTDKILGLSLQIVQEEVSKAPQSVSVNVRLNDGKRTIRNKNLRSS